MKEWLTLVFTGLTALFTGLMWWLAHKSLEPYFELSINGGSTFDCMQATLSINNRGYTTLLIDQVRPYSPIGLTISPFYSTYDAQTGAVSLRPEWADFISYPLSIAPGAKSSGHVLLRLPEDLRFSTMVSISVRIRRRSWTIPYRMKVVTAILPANIKKAHD